MPSLGDSAVIIFLGLLLFGPKGLAQIARQLGKLMGEFRRASNEFRMQMEEELRVSEQADRQKQIAAIEAAAPAPPVPTSSGSVDSELPHIPAGKPVGEAATAPLEVSVPLPIATSGGLSIMPPATGLPAPRSSSLSSLLSAVPRVDAPSGHADVDTDGSEQRPMRYASQSEGHVPPSVEALEPTSAESVHG